MKRYRVTLEAPEREEIEKLISRGKAVARRLAHAHALVELDNADAIDWDLWSIDAMLIRASRATAGAAGESRKERTASPRTTPWGPAAAGLAASCT